MHIDRTSDHRFLANFFRLYLHAAAFNLLVRFRQAMALLPLPEAERWRHYQGRRQRDRLAQAPPCTWRTLLLKVAAEISVSTRRVLIRLSAQWPHLNYFQWVCQSLTTFSSTSLPSTS